jgi:hypothetical protein
VTVTSAVLTSLAITPQNVSLAVGSTQQLTATGTFSDGTTENLTNQVNWISGSSFVTVSSNGLARAVGPAGTSAIIQAFVDVDGVPKSATTIVMVTP